MSTCGLDVVDDFVNYFTTPVAPDSTDTAPSCVELKILESHPDLKDPSPIFNWVCPSTNSAATSPDITAHTAQIKYLFETIDTHVERWNTILMHTLNKSSHVGPILASNTVNIFSKWMVFANTYLRPSLQSVWVASAFTPLEFGNTFNDTFDDFGRFSNYPEKVHPCSRWVIQLCALAALEVLTETRLFQFTRGVYGFRAGMATCESPHSLSARNNMAKVRMGNASAFQLRESGITAFKQDEGVNKTDSEALLTTALEKLGPSSARKENVDVADTTQLESAAPEVVMTTFWSHVKAHTATDDRVWTLRLCILWNCSTLLQLLKHQIMPGVGIFTTPS